MAKIISASINVEKIIKERLHKGEKGTYLNLTISINDEVDGYGNCCSIQQSITKEEREGGMEKNYLGNGKQVWSNEGKAPEPSAPVSAPAPIQDDLPF